MRAALTLEGLKKRRRSGDTSEKGCERRHAALAGQGGVATTAVGFVRRQSMPNCPLKPAAHRQAMVQNRPAATHAVESKQYCIYHWTTDSISII